MPLHSQIQASDEIQRALIGAKADLAAADMQGMTALHCLGENCHGGRCQSDFMSRMAKMFILIKAGGGTVLFAKNKKGKPASQVGNRYVWERQLHREEERRKDFGVTIDLKPN